MSTSRAQPASADALEVVDVVGDGCLVGSCKRCASCDAGLEQYCENGFVATYNGPTGDPPVHTLGGSHSG